MKGKERYVCKKISKDCLFPEILCELKDTESKFFVVLESKDDAVKIADLLNHQDKRIKKLEQENLFFKEQNKSLIDEEEYIFKKMQEVGFDNIEDLCKTQKQVHTETITVDSGLTVNNSLTISSEMEGNKVYIWGYELCKGSEWNDFLEVANKLGEENQQLKEQISKMEETHKRIMSGEYIPSNIAEKFLELNTQSQKQLAISNLEDVYQVVKDYNSEANKYEPYIDTLDIEQYIDDKIKELKELKMVTDEWIDATEEKCLDDLNELTEDLSWQYQLDDLDKLKNKAQNIQSICERLKHLKGEK